MDGDMMNPGYLSGNGEGLARADVGLERKFARFGENISVNDSAEISGYASLFGNPDQGGDVVSLGAYSASLEAASQVGQRIKMLWQHDPSQPIGVWDEVREDARGLWVKGRILESVAKGREAAALIAAGAIDGLSIGYRTVRAANNDQGQRVLTELDLWEVSLVTFPMLPSARVSAKADVAGVGSLLHDMANAFQEARDVLAR